MGVVTQVLFRRMPISGTNMLEAEAENWLERLVAGDMSAAEQLWQHFFTRLQSYAASRVRQLPLGVADADDVAASVFRSLCCMVDRRTIPAVAEAEQLWPLLAVIAARKIAKVVRRARPGQQGQQFREADLSPLGVCLEDVQILGQAIGREPSPELAAVIGDVWESLYQRLNGVEKAIVAYRRDDRTMSEISQSTGLSERSISRKLVKIQRILRDLGCEPTERQSGSSGAVASGRS